MTLEDTIVDAAKTWYSEWYDVLNLNNSEIEDYIYDGMRDDIPDFYDYWFGYNYMKDQEIIDEIIIPFYKEGLYNGSNIHNANIDEPAVFASEICAYLSEKYRLYDKVIKDLNI